MVKKKTFILRAHIILIEVKVIVMSDEELQKITGLLEEILKWNRILAISQLKKIFTNNLDEEERLIYELSDGVRSIRDIETLSKVSRSKISMLWKKWRQIGIMEKSTKYEGKRMKRSFSLEDVGIEMPTLSIPADNSQNKPEEEFE